MAGLSPEQILNFGQYEQGNQQLRQATTSQLTDAAYKEALSNYYNAQQRNQANKIAADIVANQRKSELTAERNKYQNLGDLARAMQIQQEINMLDAGTHPSQTGTQAALISAGAAAQNAATGVKTERRQAAQYLLDEENSAVDRQVKQDNLRLNQLREARLTAKTQAEMDNIDSQIQATQTKIGGTVADTVAAIADAKGNEVKTKGYIDLYNRIVPDDAIDIYAWSTKGRNQGRPKRIFDEESGRYATMGELRELAASQGISVTELINNLAGGE